MLLEMLIPSGELSSDELKGAIVKILKRSSTDAEAQEIVNMLDHDHDGKVSVVDLLKYIEDRTDRIEVEALEVTFFISDPVGDVRLSFFKLKYFSFVCGFCRIKFEQLRQKQLLIIVQILTNRTC